MKLKKKSNERNTRSYICIYLYGGEIDDKTVAFNTILKKRKNVFHLVHMTTSIALPTTTIHI